MQASRSMCSAMLIPDCVGGAQAKFSVARGIVMLRDGFACQRCGSCLRLRVHHMDGHGLSHATPNNDTDNLTTLCSACHGRAHATSDRIRPPLLRPPPVASPKSLRWYRERALLTLGELAFRAGVSRETVSSFERGRYCPQPRTVRKLAGVLRVDPRKLVETLG